MMFLGRQPDGKKDQNCLVTFRPGKPTDDSNPLYYDRPCFENDEIGEPGHKFMCECEIVSSL